jgi:RNA polymerase sigma factor (sigma-70 family)
MPSDVFTAQFPPTLWSLVLRAGGNGSERSQEALATLCGAYWYPLYAFLRRQGKTVQDAEDLTQGFFLHLLQKNGLNKVRPQKGRFRTFLLAALKHFLADEWSKSTAQKRGGGAAIVSFESAVAEERYEREAPTVADPEQLFERRWAMTLLEQALQRLEAEFSAAGKKERFEQLQKFLSGERGHGSYADVAKRLDLTEGAVKIAVLRLRQRYRDLLYLEVGDTVDCETDIEDEIRHLFAVLNH